jgi:hypothetical protein
MPSPVPGPLLYPSGPAGESERERARERVRAGERFRHFIQQLNVGQYRRLQRIFFLFVIL